MPTTAVNGVELHYEACGQGSAILGIHGTPGCCGPAPPKPKRRPRETRELNAAIEVVVIDGEEGGGQEGPSALEVQLLLADRGQHRAPSIPDLPIAATAEKVGLTVLAADKDFSLIAAITGQPIEITSVSPLMVVSHVRRDPPGAPM